MTARTAGLTAAITFTVLIGAIHAGATLMLSTRRTVEDWLIRRAHKDTGMYPRDWHWPGLPR